MSVLFQGEGIVSGLIWGLLLQSLRQREVLEDFRKRRFSIMVVFFGQIVDFLVLGKVIQLVLFFFLFRWCFLVQRCCSKVWVGLQFLGREFLACRFGSGDIVIGAVFRFLVVQSFLVFVVFKGLYMDLFCLFKYFFRFKSWILIFLSWVFLFFFEIFVFLVWSCRVCKFQFLKYVGERNFR